MQIIDGDLLSYSTNKIKYIVQQCNCQTVSAKGLSEKIFKRWPVTNTYTSRKKRHTGTIDLFQICDKEYVVNVYGQNFPGKSHDQYETKEMRLQWFITGLHALSQQAHPNSEITFPYMIGCGLAGGNWNDYLHVITKFADHVYQTKGIIVTIIQLKYTD